MTFRIFFNAPTDLNGAAPVDASTEVERNRKIAEKSPDQIVDSVFSGEITPVGNVQVPLGDTPPIQNGVIPQNPNQSTPPAPAPNFSKAFSEIDALNAEIEQAQLEGGKSPESVRSFDGLKARYKNGVTQLRTQLELANTQITALTQQMTELPKIKEHAERYAEVAPELEKMEQKVTELEKENEALGYYRRRYDLEKDPKIQQEYLTPMDDLKSRSVDIIQNHNQDPEFWDQLVSCDSEFKLNKMIDDARISGMNAQSLKRYVSGYRQLKDEYRQISSPEFIESSLEVAKGQRVEATAKVADSIFNSMRSGFAEWMKEIEESDVNKEHNFYVHDRAMDQATRNYNALRKTVPLEYQTQHLLQTLAKASLMVAAYPLQRQMLDHSLKLIGEFQKERAGNSHSVRQIRENPFKQTGINVEEIKQSSARSIDDIAKEAFQNPNL